jgi:hypothetical protein
MSHVLTANIDIEDNIEQERWDYTNTYYEWEGEGIQQ